MNRVVGQLPRVHLRLRPLGVRQGAPRYPRLGIRVLEGLQLYQSFGGLFVDALVLAENGGQLGALGPVHVAVHRVETVLDRVVTEVLEKVSLRVVGPLGYGHQCFPQLPLFRLKQDTKTNNLRRTIRFCFPCI